MLGHENVVVVIKYDKKILLPLLMKANKLLMFDRLKQLMTFI
jgi:hypothetical protein